MNTWCDHFCVDYRVLKDKQLAGQWWVATFVLALQCGQKGKQLGLQTAWVCWQGQMARHEGKAQGQICEEKQKQHSVPKNPLCDSALGIVILFLSQYIYKGPHLSPVPFQVYKGRWAITLTQKSRTGLGESLWSPLQLHACMCTQRSDYRESNEDEKNPATDNPQVVESWLLNELSCFLETDLCS